MADEEVEEREMLTDSKDGLTGYQSVPRKDEPTTGRKMLYSKYRMAQPTWLMPTIVNYSYVIYRR